MPKPQRRTRHSSPCLKGRGSWLEVMKRWFFSLTGLLILALVPAACGGTTETGSSSPTPTMGIDHGNMGTMTGNAPFDAQFIDSMIQHHQGAIAMAKQAQIQTEHSELKTLAQNIITDQQNEITQMQNWRKQWYPNHAPTGGMGMNMGHMDISTDTSKPFDLRFINAMISHHEGAILMAKEAQIKAEHSEIKTLANAIITAQTKEINEMKQWKQQWYGASHI